MRTYFLIILLFIVMSVLTLSAFNGYAIFDTMEATFFCLALLWIGFFIAFLSFLFLDNNHPEQKIDNPIIWDSGFGYEVGYFICDSDKTMMNSCKVNLVTGIKKGELLISKKEIIPYEIKKLDELSKKYGYRKNF